MTTKQKQDAILAERVKQVEAMNKTNTVGDVISSPCLLGEGEWVIVYVYTTYSSDHGHPDSFTNIPTICYKLKPRSDEIDWSVRFKMVDQSSDHHNHFKYVEPLRQLLVKWPLKKEEHSHKGAVH